MRIEPNYRINENTVYLTGMYDQFANLCSVVVDREEQFLVTVPPVELINNALLNNGSNFQGAVNSSKFLLGDIKMPPVHVNTILDICLIPTKSSKRQNCVWFSHSHIKKTKAVGCKKTEVYLSFGHTYEILMKENAFNHKRQKAAELKEHITINSQNSQGFNLEPKKGLYIRESQQENTYVKKK